MDFMLDVHLHTVNSNHGYSTLMENVCHAKDIGLTHIGICDHGPAMPGGAHIYHFGNLKSLPEMVCGIRVYKGAEVNFLPEGGLDLPDDILRNMDFVIGALHRHVVRPGSSDMHTRIIMEAMQHANMHILGHPCDAWFDIDLERIVAEAKKTGTILEVNNQSLKPVSLRYNGNEPFVQMLRLAREMRVAVLASSDAHFCTTVGDLGEAHRLIMEAQMPPELVLNTSADLFTRAIAHKRALCA